MAEDVPIQYSVVIPCYNEEECVYPLYKRLVPVMDALNQPYEIVFVDDGSSDKTFEYLSRIHRLDPRVRVVRFRKNFGQTAGLSAGFQHARGNVIITMDADLQNDPKDIPKLLSKMTEGYDVVSGWRHDRKDPGVSKKLPSKISNRLARWLTGLDIHDSGCSLKAYTKESVADISLFGEMHRFVPALSAMNGFKIGEVKVAHHARTRGKTKYGSGRIVRGFLDLLYIKFWSKYSGRPLHFFGSLGIIQLALGLVLGFYKVIGDLFIYRNPLEMGPLLLFSALLLIMGAQFIIFGFLSEIQIRIYYGRYGNKSFHIETVLE